MDYPSLFLLGRALRTARLGNSDMRSFGAAHVVARFNRTRLAEYVEAPVESSPEALMRLLGVEPAAVMALISWDRDDRPWLTCTLRSDAARALAHRVLDALTDAQAAALRLNDAIDALSPVGGPEQPPISATSYNPGVVTVDIPPESMHYFPHIVAATKPDRFETSPHPLQGILAELTVRQADQLTATLLAAAAPSGEHA
ncbi:hypothetical protein ACWHAU_28480 [Streptomyces albidoflavus]